MPFKDPEVRRAYNKRYRANHLEELNAYGREYHAANREKENADSKRYRDTHLKQQRAKEATYNLTHHKERRVYGKKYRVEHREKRRVYDKGYPQTLRGKDVKRQKDRKYKHQHRAAGILDVRSFYARCAELEWYCQLCGKKLTKENVTIDHIIPISRGGTNDKDNLQPLCSSCNSYKNTRLMEELEKGAVV
jgi:5-methylcytosine-specific restriction endonuclease McrA